MASGDTIFVLGAIDSHLGGGSAVALRDILEDTAAAGMTSLSPVLTFIDAVERSAEWVCIVPEHYGGGGFTWRYYGGTDGNATGAVHMDLRIKKIADNTFMEGDLNLDGQTQSSIDDAQPAFNQDFQYSTTANLSHANAGSPAGGDYVIIRLTRDGVTDSNGDHMQIAKIHIYEQ